MSEIIVQSYCDEPKGKILRSVSLTELDVEKLRFLWEKLKDFDTLFNDFVKGNFEAFVNHFIIQVDGQFSPAGLMWDVDDIGLFFLNELRPCESAMAHFVFWDRRFRGREQLCRDMLKYAFETYKFRRITVEVPLYAKFTLEHIERIGFVREGRKRKAILYKDDWFDVNSYSILPEDLDSVNPGIMNRRSVCWDCGNTFSKKEKEIQALESLKEIANGPAN